MSNPITRDILRDGKRRSLRRRDVAEENGCSVEAVDVACRAFGMSLRAKGAAPRPPAPGKPSLRLYKKPRGYEECLANLMIRKEIETRGGRP